MLYEVAAKREYSKFLRSNFWRSLSSQKRQLVGSCERCGSREVLQAHHKIYRGSWFDTRLEDLEVLCRRCHRKHHRVKGGSGWFSGLMIYRDDWRFSVILHRIGCLNVRLYSGRGILRPRDIGFLLNAIMEYPPTKGDSCMEFHVNKALKANELAKKGLFKC